MADVADCVGFCIGRIDAVDWAVFGAVDPVRRWKACWIEVMDSRRLADGRIGAAASWRGDGRALLAKGRAERDRLRRNEGR